MNNQLRLVIFSQGYERKYTSVIEGLNSIEGVFAADNLKDQNLFLRVLRRIHILSKVPGIGFWLGDWKKVLPECDTLICMANMYSPYILRWVKKHYPNIRCINYFWDEIVVSGYPIIKTDEFENWSFCRGDCEQYGLNFNPQFYAGSTRLPELPAEYDVVFVGADREGKWKSRADELNKVLKLLKQEKLTSYIWFVSENPSVPEEVRKKKRLSEREYQTATAKAKAVLELVDLKNPWMTLRPLLALKNGKKVITNNPSIQKEKFYSPSNVFILGHDSDDKLKEFIDTPFEEISEEVLHYYEASEWIERFDE